MSLAAAACVLAAIAWAYLLAGHGGYWRTDQRLPAARAGCGGDHDQVSNDLRQLD